MLEDFWHVQLNWLYFLYLSNTNIKLTKRLITVRKRSVYPVCTGADTPWTDTPHPPSWADGYSSGLYASYWNACITKSWNWEAINWWKKTSRHFKPLIHHCIFAVLPLVVLRLLFLYLFRCRPFAHQSHLSFRLRAFCIYYHSKRQNVNCIEDVMHGIN